MIAAVENNLYSVPYQLIHEKVEVRVTASVVEVLFKGKRVASHPRKKGKGHYSTNPEHMPRSHREHLEWTPSRLLHWAEQSGRATGRLVAGILESCKSSKLPLVRKRPRDAHCPSGCLVT